MRTLRKPFGALAGAIACWYALASLGRLAPDPLDARHVATWMQRTDPVDAFVELVRVTAMVISAYVAVVALLALVVAILEFRALHRAANACRYLSALVAIPALRKRLFEVATATSLTVAAPVIAMRPAGAVPTQVDSTHEVAPGDNLWRIVENHYGRADTALVNDVAAASNIADPSVIHAGQIVNLPAFTTDASWAVHTVVAGDTLWEIIERHYGHADADLVWRVAEANELADPSRIFPGQQITLPPLDERVAAPEVIAPPPPVVEAVPPPPVPESVPAPVVVEPPLVVVTEPVAEPATIAEPSMAPVVAEHADDGERVRPSIQQIVGWTGSAALAAGLLAFAHHLRTERPRRRRPAKAAVHVDLALRTSKGLDDIAWADAVLRDLAAKLRRRPADGIVRLAQLDERGLEILWDQPQPKIVDGWTTANNGWSWLCARATEVTLLDTPAPCPALVSIGRHDQATVLMNLESAGVIALDGTDDNVEALARTLLMELAVTPFADAATILAVDLPVEFSEHLDRIEHTTLDDAEQWLRERTGGNAFNARCNGDPHEPVIVMTASTDIDDLHRLATYATPDSGCVVIALRPPSGLASATMSLEDATVTVSPLGLRLESLVVRDEGMAAVKALVDDAALVMADDLAVTDFMAPVEEQPATDPIELEDLDYDVEVRILGQVDCPGYALTPGELELLVYLCTHRHGDTGDTILTMLWPEGTSMKTLNNRMHGLRKKLGFGSDGELLVPRVTDGRYRVSDRVVTDWDSVRRHLPTLDRSPDRVARRARIRTIVQGPPFRSSRGYTWAFSEGLVTAIEIALETSFLVDPLALSNGANSSQPNSSS